MTATFPMPAGATGPSLISAEEVTKTFWNGKNEIVVLDRISLELRENEFVALLGPSGSGKSTLLRVLAGLIPPSSGCVLAHGEETRGPNPNVAVVFQSFALYPWLTVLDNVEIGLLATGLSSEERRRRAVAAIDLIGLDGFEHAYPKEISGGMRQRVGFARALVVEPEVLMMDEPFSALDVLTAANLRHELSDLWRQKRIPTKCILMITHNIDDAVAMADRLIVLAANPGRIRLDIPGLPPDQRMHGESHTRMVDYLYQVMTNPSMEPAAPPMGPVGATTGQVSQMLPHISIGDLAGLLERLVATDGRADLYDLARDLRIEADDLLPLTEAADITGLADVAAGDMVLTDAGRRFAEADVLDKKRIFREQVQFSVELMHTILELLAAAPDHRLDEEVVFKRLTSAFSEQESRRQLDTVIDWGRYGELFRYNDLEGRFTLEDDEAGDGVPAAG